MATVSRALGVGIVSCILVMACTAGPELAVEGTSTTSGGDSGGETGTDAPTASAAEETEPTTTDDPTVGEAVCCGCLCVDPAWSCAAETCVDAAGKAVALAPEAGFLALAPYTFSIAFEGEETTYTTPEARIWYMFRPADEQPETRPLAVFFNGGPGYSSAILFGLNTNAVTLDPDVVGDEVVAANPDRWTRFANVLYIDPREAGYSYDIMPEDPQQALLEFTPERDAADFVRVLLAFLARHPQIQKNPVMLVGESYGGNRSAVMLGQILFPERLVTRPRYRDPALRDLLLEHLAVVFPEASPGGLTPEVIAGQFGHQVMIQPALTWLALDVTPTPDEQRFADLGCVPEPDVSQCDEPAMWSSIRTRAVIDALTDPVHLAAALGVDPTTIAWMYADARAAAIPRGWNGRPEDEHALRAVFGELSKFEDYYHPSAGGGGWVANGGIHWQSGFYVQAYLESLYFTRTFITNAGKDPNVYAPDIPMYLAATEEVVAAAVHDEAPRPGEARPGWIRLSYVPKVVPGEPEREVRFPHYPIGGHMVSHKQGAELADDVCRWWLTDCPLP